MTVTVPTDDFLCVTSNVDAPMRAAAAHASAPAWPPPTTITSYCRARSQQYRCLLLGENGRTHADRHKHLADMADAIVSTPRDWFRNCNTTWTAVDQSTDVVVNTAAMVYTRVVTMKRPIGARELLRAFNTTVHYNFIRF